MKNIVINQSQKKEILSIWENYSLNNKIVIDTKGKEITNIDNSRLDAINDIKEIINDFIKGSSNIYEFKTSLDSYNKRNNLWGFPATKGQMFFNQLVKNNEENIKELAKLLIKLIQEPKDLNDALNKINELEKLVTKEYTIARDKRKAANPGSVGYFLSYFWQIFNHDKWPILYTSLIKVFTKLDLWQDSNLQKDSYEYFFNINAEIISFLKKQTKKNISIWDAEHAFWSYNNNLQNLHIRKNHKTNVKKDIEENVKIVNANFDINDYLLPKIKDLVVIGGKNEKASVKGSKYEKLVAEIFKLLDFDVEILGQGKGREPDAIIKNRADNTAFIVDAKAYSDGYSLGIDDRAIKEYINYHCPRLGKSGYKKIGFIIVSNSFKTNLDSFISDITWNTEVKRFILLTSEALLHLFAYKMKDKLSLDLIIEKLVSNGNLVDKKYIVEQFEDV